MTPGATDNCCKFPNGPHHDPADTRLLAVGYKHSSDNVRPHRSPISKLHNTQSAMHTTPLTIMHIRDDQEDCSGCQMHRERLADHASAACVAIFCCARGWTPRHLVAESTGCHAAGCSARKWLGRPLSRGGEESGWQSEGLLWPELAG